MNDLIWTYKLLPFLPAPPLEFCAVDLDWRPNDPTVTTTGLEEKENQATNEYLVAMPERRQVRWYGVTSTGATHRRRPVSPAYESWVRKNLVPEFIDAGVSYADGGPTSGAHTDISRDYSLIWLLEPGGPEAALGIWRHRDRSMPVIWDRHVNFFDSDDLTNLAMSPGNPGCWYLLHSKILHSVEGLCRSRVGLQVSLQNDPWPDVSGTHIIKGK